MPRFAALVSMCDAVEALAEACEGDHRPDCPILDDLEGIAGKRTASTGDNYAWARRFTPRTGNVL
jgi:hypothetical protein